jgi:hypothetical protein
MRHMDWGRLRVRWSTSPWFRYEIENQAFFRIKSTAFSATMIVVAFVLPPTMVGMIDASATRNAPTPRTRSCALRSCPARRLLADKP